MPSTYSTNLRLELMANGEKSGTWGTITNTNLGTLLEQAISGVASVAHDDSANYSLTTNNGSSDEARNAVVVVTGTLTAARNLVVPSTDKFYIIKNGTTGGYAITVKTSGGTGVAIANGNTKAVYCDATNVEEAITEVDLNQANFGDNDKAIFGAGSDLQIYHDASNSYIKDNGTGDLKLQGNNFTVGNTADTKYFTATNGGGVELYHQGNEKLVTTSTGINVTGTVTSDGADLDGAVVINEAGASVDFRVESDNNTHMLFVDGSADAVGIGTSSLGATLHVDAPSTTAPSLTFGATAGQIFQNENSELAIGLSNSSPYPLYVQGRTSVNAARDIVLQPLGGSVGIGTSSPGQPLEILSNTAEVSLNSSSSTYSRVVHEHNGTAMWTTGTRAATDYHIFRESGSGNVVIDAGSLDVGGNDTGGAGLINVYGGGSGEGGEIRIYPSAAEDTTVDFWSIDVATDDLRVFNNLGDLALTTIANGSVDLYHDGGHKFSTTASGIALNGGQTSQISIKSTGGSGFTQGDIVIEGHASDSSPGTRGQGIYYFNEGNDRTYYSGTLYNNGTVWGVASTTGTSLATAAANTTNSLLAVDGVSGGVRIGTTSNIFNSATNERASIKNPSTGAALTLQSTDVTGGFPILYLSSTDTTAGQNAVVFQRTGGVVGTITTTASATAYNTSSDYRLKQNVTALTGAIDRVKTLSPKRFSFIAEPDKTVDGFLAHEVTTVPEAIVGTKDQVDADGNPVYQGIDQSKLVPLLTAALQEAVAKIESLETRIAALEAN